MIIINGDYVSRIIYYPNAPVLSIEADESKESLRFENPKHIQQPFIEQVVRYFRGESTNPCPLEEALVTMQMMDATL